MKKIFYFTVAALSFVLASCSEDDNLNDQSVLDTSVPELTELDQWIRNTFTTPYNIEVIYKWKEGEYSMERFLKPPFQENVQPALEVVKKIWLDSYTEVGGEDFVKKIAPRQLALSGGFNTNPSGTITLGLAEGGKKITFFNVDFLDTSDRENVQQFLGTIQHEYTHILNQTRPFDEETWGTITPSGYTGNWYENTDEESQQLGFVTAYARSDVTEDFAEMVHIFLNYDNEGWNNFIDSIPNTDARDAIRTKEAMVADYFQSAFNIDIYELQAVVAEHTDEIIN